MLTLTQERADKLSEILTADPERAKALFELEPVEALSQINALGNDFTLDEISEFGQVVKDVIAHGELDADALDNVAGGIVFLPVAVAVGIMGGAFGAGYKFGTDLAKTNQW